MTKDVPRAAARGGSGEVRAEDEDGGDGDGDALEHLPSRARELALELIEIAPDDDEDDDGDEFSSRKERRRRICAELLGLIVRMQEGDRQRGGEGDAVAALARPLEEHDGGHHGDDRETRRASSGETEEDGGGKGGEDGGGAFIRTALAGYNNKDTRAANAGDLSSLPRGSDRGGGMERGRGTGGGRLGVRELLGNLPSSTTSRLTSALTRLLTDRIEPSKLLPATQDEAANLEVMGLRAPDDDDEEESVDGGGRKKKAKKRKSDKTVGSGDPFASGAPPSSTSAAAARSAMTLSTQSLLAARIYALLISSRGAWGAGLVEVGGLSAMSALVRRWCLECRGREPGGKWRGAKKCKGKEGKKKRGGESKRARTSEWQEKKQPARKSSRVKRAVVTFAEDDDSSSSGGEDAAESYSIEVLEGNDDILDDNGSDEQLTDRALVLRGLSLAESLGRAPLVGDYRNWSPEAREAYADAASTALATASALLRGCCDGGDPEAARACRDAASSLEHGLRTSLFSSSGSAGTSRRGVRSADRSGSQGRRGRSPVPTRTVDGAADNDDHYDGEGAAIAREGAVHLFRGLLPTLSQRFEVPNGARGKESARAAAADLVTTIAKLAAEESRVDDAARGRVHSSGVAGDAHINGEEVKKVTPVPSSRRGGRRSSGGGTASKSVTISATPRRGGGGKSPNKGSAPRQHVPPSLKKTVTPKQRIGAGAGADTRGGPLSHPILGVVVGMLQRTFTSKGLERAEARNRVSALGLDCMSHLPPTERAQLLRFVASMCSSKVSSHRLFGVELIGEALCRGWVWTDHADRAAGAGAGRTIRATDGDAAATPRSGGTAPTPADSVPASLLRALQARLADRAPAVRARAAHSLAEAIRRTGGGGTADAPPDRAGAAADPAARSALRDALLDVGPSLLASLRRRACKDEKATVRRASIAAWLQALLLMRRRPDDGGGGVDHDFSFMSEGKRSPPSSPRSDVSRADVAALASLCLDPSVATRKAAADAVTRLLLDRSGEESSRAMLESAWAGAVLPLALDSEATCVAKAAELFSTVVVEPIVGFGDRADGDGDGDGGEEEGGTRRLVAWRVLASLGEGSKEAGAARGGTGALQAVLRRLVVDAGAGGGTLVRGLLREVRRVGMKSLGLEGGVPVADLFRADTETMRVGAWCFLDALTSSLSDTGAPKSSSSANVSLKQAIRGGSIDSSFLTLSWKKLRELHGSSEMPPERKASVAATSRDCLKIIARMGGFVPLRDAERCFKDLLEEMETFRISTDLVGAGASALASLCKRVSDDAGTDAFDACERWIRGMMNKCEMAIDSYLASLRNVDATVNIDDIILERVIFSVGEMSLVGFSSDEDTANLTSKKTREKPTIHQPVKGLLVRPSRRLVDLVKLMLLPSLPKLGDEYSPPRPTPRSIRAYAFISLGKLCLRDEKLAKECLTILARELHQDKDSHPSVQSNALLVMGDLCVRYTNLVDKYLPIMASCIQAGEASNAGNTIMGYRDYSVVKKHAILILSGLLLQDYIKWRGLLIHRFFAAAADENEEVACLARATLCGPLLGKQRNLLYNSFVEAIFVLNCCKAHPIYAAAATSGDNGSGLVVDFEGTSLAGSNGCRRRLEVYRMMLSNMSDEEKLGVTVRLVKEVLGGALETSGDLSAVCRLSPRSMFSPNGSKSPKKISNQRLESATNVLTDTLVVLTSPDVRVGRKSTEEADPEDDLIASQSAPKSEQLNAVKGRLLTKISRKYLMETVVPILCNLKTVLEGSRSPLLRDLMRYLVYIFRSYKAEVKELLANDPNLLQELEYDTRQYEKKRRESITQREKGSDVPFEGTQLQSIVNTIGGS